MHLNDNVSNKPYPFGFKFFACRRRSLSSWPLLIVLFLLSYTARAQDNNPLITLSEKNVPLTTIFSKIEAQTSYQFLYENKLLERVKKVSIDTKNMPLVKVLELLNMNLAKQQLGLKIIDKTIVLKQLAAITPIPFRSTGIIINAVTKLPIQGVTVKSKREPYIAGATNAEGYFDLPGFQGDTLIVSYIGFETLEIVASGSKTANFSLKPMSKTLDEVVVTNGYQELDQRTLTSAITTLKAKDILVPGIFTIDQALEGRVPGLFVVNNSGEVGSAPKIRIRGTSTILGNQDPVWVVDGVVVNSPLNIDPQTVNDLDFVNRLGNAISGLNPADIDEINVLKDASATALYGVRAANGVIVITTKKGHAGPPVINYSISGTFTGRPSYNNINVMNSQQRIQYSEELVAKGLNYPSVINYVGYEGALHDLYDGTTNYGQFEQQVGQMETRNTDWFGAITQNTLATQNNLSISGGSNKMRYFVSLGVSDEPGTIRGDKVKRYTSTVNLNADINDKLQWNMSLISDIDQRNFVAQSVNALNYAYNTSRAIPLYNPDGSLSYYQRYSQADDNYFDFNILNEINNSRDISNGGSIRLNTNLNYKISNVLKATVLFAYSYSNTTEQISYGANTFYAANLRGSDYGVPLTSAEQYETTLPVGGELQTNLTRNNSYTVRTQFDFNKSFGNNNINLITATLGGEASSNQYTGYSTDRRGYLPDRGETFAAIDPTKYPSYAQWALLDDADVIKDELTNLLSAYFTTSYTYNSRYTLNFNTRTDFSNKFGSESNSKFLPTWSVSGRWDMAQDLFKDSKTVNVLAFRGSYGYQGNMLDYQTPNLIIKQGDPDPITGENSSTIAYYPNPNLQWEKTGEINTAIDFSFLQNKINGSLSYFYKKTTNAFLDKAVSDINGLDTYVVNSGQLVNQGLEVALSFTPINGGNGFKWRIDPQLGEVINKLIGNALNTNVQNQATGNPNTFSNYLNGTALINGKAINSFYSYQFAGLSHTNGMPTFKNDDPSNAALYASLTNDQVYQMVMQPSGNRIPTIQGGINNYFSYKSVFLSCNLTYSLGAKVRLFALYPDDANGVAGNPGPLPEENVSAEFLKRWQNPGDETHTTIPALLNYNDYVNTELHWSYGQTYQYANNIWQMYDNSDIRIVSADYLRVSALQIGFKIPDKILKKWKLKDTFISLAGTNLFTLDSRLLHGQDPSQAGFSAATQVPIQPTYSFNLSVSL